MDADADDAKPYPLPAREAERLAALRAYDVLDTPPEPAYDDLAMLAARLCGTPIALVTLVDGRCERPPDLPLLTR